MNRAERRKLGIPYKPETTYTIKHSELHNMVIQAAEKEIERVREETYRKSITCVIACYNQAMHEALSLGPERIKRVNKKVNEILQCVDKEVINIQDIIQWAEDYGIEITERKAG